MPVPTFIQDVASRFAAGRNVVVHAPTGAGKSTELPLALLREGIARGRILLVQPRQVAARAVAARIAERFGCALGHEVGYQVRFDRKATKNTRLLVVTTGIAREFIQSDPSLERDDIVLLDEFHERSVDMDLLVAFVRESQQALREDIRIGVLSATLEVDAIQRFLDADLVRAKGRSFPLDIHYQKRTLPAPWRDREWGRSWAALIRQALDKGQSDVLAFLPGVGEIRRVHEEVAGPARSAGVEVLELYGAMRAHAQDAVLRAGKGRRVVLATNVAETSLTVPGIDTVVDFGWVRRARVHPGLMMNRIMLERVSRASADQRAGRAGRLRAGTVFRAWTEGDHRRLEGRETPEIERVDGASMALEVLRWQGRNVASFGWFQPPDPHTLEAATALLNTLHFTRDGAMTAAGSVAATLPLHPRLSRMVLAAKDGAARADAQWLAALLSESSFPRGFDLGRLGAESDVAYTLQQLRGGGRLPGHRSIARVQQSIERKMCQTNIGASGFEARTLPVALLSAFPDRLAKRREPGAMRALLSTGVGVRLDSNSTVRRSDFFVALDVDARQRDALCVRAAVGIPNADLPQTWVEEEVAYRFSDADARVEARRIRRIGAIVLSERPVPCADSARVAAVLKDAARTDVARHYKHDKAAVRWLGRWEFAHRHLPERFEALDEDFWSRVLEMACADARSFADLKRQQFAQHFKNAVGWSAAKRLDALAPVRMRAASGKEHVLEYTEHGPVLAVRIQELFGSTTTPSILDGRVPVTLHLLAPNYRPQQVTDDLQGFWEHTYPEVRKELRARYPKHAWPEDPLQAKPQRGAKRRK